MSKMTEGTNWGRLTKELREVPLSWLPALLLLIVEECAKRPCFVSPEAMKRLMDRQVDRYWRKL